MKKKVVVSILCAGLLAGLALFIRHLLSPPFECTDPIGCVAIKPGEPLKLGVLQDLSGRASAFGTVQLNSARIALEDRGGQVLGHPVELFVLDEKCTAEDGTTGMLRIVADPQIVGVFGTTCSGSAVTASKIMSEAGLVMISGINSGASLTSIAGKRAENWQPGYFRTSHPQALGVRASASYAIQQLGVKKAAVVHTGETFTRELAEVFTHTFTKQGGEIAIETEVNPGETNMLPVLTAIARSGAEALYLSLYPPEAIPLIKQAGTVEELEKMVFFGAESLPREDFLQAVGQDGLGFYSSIASHKTEGPDHDIFLAKYQEKYGEKPQTIYYSCAYDAINLLLAAIESTAVTHKDGTIYLGRQALRDALYATPGFEGLSGRIGCDAFGDCSHFQAEIIRFDDPSKGLEGFKSNVVYTFSPDEADRTN